MPIMHKRERSGDKRRNGIREMATRSWVMGREKRKHKPNGEVLLLKFFISAYLPSSSNLALNPFFGLGRRANICQAIKCLLFLLYVFVCPTLLCIFIVTKGSGEWAVDGSSG